MPSGRDFGSGRRGGVTTKRNAFCSFCRKSYRDVGPLVEGPGDVYICGECIDLCQSILEQERRRRGTSKRPFSKIPAPREIVKRPKKGFNMPVAHWLTSELRDLALDMFAEERIKRQGFFNYSCVEHLLNEHFSRQRDNRKLLWTLLIFQLWYDAYIGS